jgi:glycosyltransferase involved in cell wall biosynthesis
MPTYNRRAFVPHAIRYFLRQDYPHKELIIIDDGTDNISDLVPVHENIRYYRLEKKITLGAKLNLACTYAKGDIIANWDDDDWYAERRLSYQVSAMRQKGIEVCGINHLLYFSLKDRQAYQYIYPPDKKVWLSGSTLCFTRELWTSHAFADINVGMDGLFVWATPPEKIKVLEDHNFSVHMIHDDNVSPKKTSGGYWHAYPPENIRQIMKDDWNSYIRDGFHDDLSRADLQETARPVMLKSEYMLMKNVYACLVHENEDCIIDLVRNLNYHDPESLILLYNGSNNPGLLTKKFPYEKFNAVIHPSPVPQKHGYLHTFALNCMAYALENYSFDIFTIVDSDQLAIRHGYCRHLSDFFATASNVGLLSSNPEHVLPIGTNNLVANQAFKEYDLWKPFLRNFPDGESKFVHWTFWPSTVFTSAAIKDLVALFKENRQLQDIMKQTKIWATEEVIFPTLVRLLGYEIAANPCSYDFVKYRKNFTTHDINSALNKQDAFWIHPVPRKYDHQLRKYVREKFTQYTPVSANHSSTYKVDGHFLLISPLINRVKKIGGWLSEAETDLLIAVAIKTGTQFPAPQHIVEIGSYQGKSTVALGNVVKYLFPLARVFAIDPHEGVVGAADQGLQKLAPTLQQFKKNIETEALTGVVELIQDYSYNVAWRKPIHMVFIDGLHDYPSVARDFRHFEEWIVPGGYIAFHDYADYYPGVKKFVHVILDAGNYKKIQLADSLIVIQKLHDPDTDN